MRIFEFSFFGITIAPTWYGLAYAIGFLAGYIFAKKRLSLTEKQVDIIFFSVFLGGILGGRIGYIIFYNLPYYFTNPLEIFATWKGGMSFHGGLIGSVLGIFLASKKLSIPFLKLSDALALITPLGIFLGRIANYVNGELYGYTPYHWPFAMMVNGESHFPSPLLEAGLEGVVLASTLWIIALCTKYKNSTGILSGIFLIGYAICRIISEFVRLPDAQVGYIFAHVTLGQILSIPFFLAGIWILLYTQKHAPQKSLS